MAQGASPCQGAVEQKTKKERKMQAKEDGRVSPRTNEAVTSLLPSTQNPSYMVLLIFMTFCTPQFHLSQSNFIAIKVGLRMHNAIILFLHAFYTVDYTSAYRFWTNFKSIGIFSFSLKSLPCIKSQELGKE